MQETIVVKEQVSWLNKTVLGAGVTSALADFANETSIAMLPGFLAVLGGPAVALGVIEGTADAIASFTKLFAGYTAERTGHRKSLAVVGYGLIPIGQIVVALAAGWSGILLGRITSGVGRGVRTPLRDAIIADAVSSTTEARAFGFHRAADALGSVLGPAAGVALLSWATGLTLADSSSSFRVVLWLAVVPSVLSVGSFALMVQDERAISPNSSLRLLAGLRGMPKNFRGFLAATGIFGLGDFSHALLIFAATTLLTPRFGILHAAEIAGLLYMGRNLIQALASYPIGVLADRWGRRRLLMAGYGTGAATSIVTSLAFISDGPLIPLLALVFVLAGVYVAVQDALEPALAAQYVSKAARSLGFGALGLVSGLGDFVSSIAVGCAWMLVSPAAGFVMAGFLMTVGAVTLAGIEDQP